MLKMPMIEAIHDAAREEREATAVASSKPARRKPSPWKSLPCPCCGEQGALSVQLDTLTVVCGTCDEVKREDFEKVISQWRALWAWIDAAP